MESKPKQYYCLRCKCFKQLVDIKRCIEKKHQYIALDYLVEYDHELIEENREKDEHVEEVIERIWHSRFIEPPDEPIKRYEYDDAQKIVLRVDEEAICPVHQKHARGFCFDCNRLICLSEYMHFKHRHLLFSDYGFKNEPIVNEGLESDPIPSKRAPLYDEQAAEIAHSLELIKENHAVLEQRKSILREATALKDKSIQLLLSAALNSSWVVTRDDCIQAACLLTTLKEDMYEANFEALETEMNKTLEKLKLYTIPIRMREFLRRISENIKPVYKIRGAFNLAFIMFETPVYVDGAGRYCTEATLNAANRDVIEFSLHINRRRYGIAMRQSTREIRIGSFDLDTYEQKQIAVAHKYRDFNHISRYVDTKLGFVSDENKLIEIDLITMEVHEVCDCECKRLITVFENRDSFRLGNSFIESENEAPLNFKDKLLRSLTFTPDKQPLSSACTYMIQKDDGSLWYMRERLDGWIRVEYDPLDDEIEAFVRSPFTTDVNKGAFMSRNYIHKADLPALPIRCNSVYFECKTLLILNRSVKVLDDKPYYL